MRRMKIQNSVYSNHKNNSQKHCTHHYFKSGGARFRRTLSWHVGLTEKHNFLKEKLVKIAHEFYFFRETENPFRAVEQGLVVN